MLFQAALQRQQPLRCPPRLKRHNRWLLLAFEERLGRAFVSNSSSFFMITRSYLILLPGYWCPLAYRIRAVKGRHFLSLHQRHNRRCIAVTTHSTGTRGSTSTGTDTLFLGKPDADGLGRRGGGRCRVTSSVSTWKIPPTATYSTRARSVELIRAL